MITVQNLTKRYGMQTLFEGLTFTVNPGEKIGLVGRNGHGKTTIFRILTGEEKSDDGNILIPKGYRIGYLKQNLDFTKPTVLEEACTALPEGEECDAWKAEKILTGLGFQEEDLERNISEFSGGYQVRLSLAKVLVSDPNMLLLDEPTNFLDIISIRWLAKFLREWRKEFIIITHDRGFMDSVVSHVMGIHRMKVRKIKGDTEDYYSQIEQEEEVHEKRRIGDEKKRKQIEGYINSFRAKASHAKGVQSHIKMLDKMEKIDKLQNIKSLSFSFDYQPFEPRTLMEAKNLTFSYTGEEPYLMKDLSFAIERNDKIGIIGKNGKGKTTLVKLLSGRLKPVSGEVKVHQLAKIGYYEQANTAELNNAKTVEDEILSAHPTGNIQRARDIAGIMMFSGDAATKKISVLSGGERCRVLLGKVIMTPLNLLVLDEPTHHMDMQSCDAMIGAIREFDGAAIVVTHDERFLHNVVNKLVVFHEDRVFLFPGTYEEFLDRIGWGGDSSIGAKNKKEDNGNGSANKKDIRKARQEQQQARTKALSPYENRTKEIERDLVIAEGELHQKTQEMIEASNSQDAKKIAELAQAMHFIQPKIEKLYVELAKVTEEYEKKKKEFGEEEL